MYLVHMSVCGGYIGVGCRHILSVFFNIVIALHFTAILCASLSSPLNGTVAFDANTIGSQANYSCSESHTLNGTTTRVCQADGQWSGSEPTCEGWSPMMCTWCI